jgi:RND family efflux transporter MFP subunit
MTVERTVSLAGTLISLDQAKVSSEVAGRVQNVGVDLGQDVRQGQMLVALEPRELELALERAHSALRQTEAQLGIDSKNDTETAPFPEDSEIAVVRTAAATLDDARAQNQRAEQLAAGGLLSTVDLETTRTRLEVAEAAYDSAIETAHSLKASLEDRRAAFLLAQKKLNDAVIKAPVSGAVAERLVQPGEFIKEDTPVITLVQMDPLKLSTGVQERYAGLIRVGMPVEFSVESFPGEVFRGEIVSVSPRVDQDTRTFAIEAELPNSDHRLKPGFFANGVIFTHRDENVLAVPEEAVSTLAGVSTVFVVENGKIRTENVTLGVHQDKLVEIVDGLNGEEQLASSNLSQLATGVAVAPPGSNGAVVTIDPSGAHEGRGRRSQ